MAIPRPFAIDQLYPRYNYVTKNGKSNIQPGTIDKALRTGLGMHVFVLMSVQPGMERQVISHLKKLDKVSEAFLIYGQYDLIIKVQADTREELWAFISREIRVIEGVRGTLTLIPIHGFKR